jgi:hypothetical protein
MTRVQTTGVLAFLIVALFAGQTARATFHEWFIKEIYSNHDGSVQFIELFTSANSQQFLPGHNIRSNGTIYNFPGNSPAPTGGHHLLLATPGYASLAAVPASGLATPNYTFAANNFFSVAGDTINFAGVDIKSFAPIPTDGVVSLNYVGFGGSPTNSANTPRNYIGTATGSLNLPPPPPPNNGDYNGDLVVNAADYTVWRNTVGTNVAQSSGADGNNNSTIDAGDYTFWKNHYGEVLGGAGAIDGDLSAVPEPSSALLLTALATLFPLRFRRNTRAATC